MVEQDDVGVFGRGEIADLIGFATAHEETRVGPVTPATDTCNRNGTGRTGQLLEFQDVFGIRRRPDAEAHEYGPFTCAGSLEHVW